MKNSIKNTIEKVSNSFPSLFSREDVIKLLTDLNSEMESEAPKSNIDKDMLLTTFREMLSQRNWDEVVDKSNVELSLNYDNRIEVEEVPIEEDFLIDSACESLEALLDTLEEEED